ncbi:uncharacterized protein F5891DRAFT_975339 [Suillus fuscotomentosus]|uniref:Uncharacterized protein n=1 Tax=Suillus fuscotomentosus TaxID=1912939 RepID=A0AAD4EHZ7_9AGAM|nr:uncharacterized protein F5891DRAFT_975339 [Suillus fuscotomentosus]KAG1906564.1 hypothetical protein F5891DRAFT_975339 [Suillus fuscotomentosus]
MSMPESNCAGNLPAPTTVVSLCISTSPQARAKRKIAALVEEVENLKQEKAINKEDLVAKNDRHCEDSDGDHTIEQNRLQRGYIELSKTLPWFYEKLASLDFEESEDMLKQLKRGADSARGDDTGTLKELVASWVNIECRPPSFLRADDKHHRGFVNDACGKLLCPAEWCWEDPVVRAGICDHTTAFIVSENSWPMFMYENYEADAKNLERGLFKSKLLVMGFKAIFTSPSSANEVDGDGDGIDIIENHQRARRQSDHAKVKTCVASIIGMRKVTPHAIAYAACQIRFALSNITSWRTVDGDFGYQLFWNNIVDFFEDPPGPAALARVNKLLEWWTRKVFGRNHHQDLTPDVILHMSVNSLASQRQQMEDATFDSN